jgi:hypothetical protein
MRRQLDRSEGAILTDACEEQQLQREGMFAEFPEVTQTARAMLRCGRCRVIGTSTVRMAARVAANNLGRLTEGSQKREAHSVGISKTSFSCNDVNR